LTSRALMPSSRWPPKPGSAAEDVQPTSTLSQPCACYLENRDRVWGSGASEKAPEGQARRVQADMECANGRRTAREEAVFREDCDGVYEEDRDCGG
jgi:hypothetical protein